ncbi:MAG: ankyrin repeat domain-containing protein, partial [Ottowia sp.]|nr:ankyrin repeat domain-containing protein [Ottowia sp.]
DAVRLLLEKGANPNATDINGDTALSLATKRGRAATKEGLTAHANDCKTTVNMLRAAGAKK